MTRQTIHSVQSIHATPPSPGMGLRWIDTQSTCSRDNRLFYNEEFAWDCSHDWLLVQLYQGGPLQLLLVW